MLTLEISIVNTCAEIIDHFRFLNMFAINNTSVCLILRNTTKHFNNITQILNSVDFIILHINVCTSNVINSFKLTWVL